jgi:hypothetical protein
LKGFSFCYFALLAFWALNFAQRAFVNFEILMDAPLARPMLNSPIREGTADAELLVKRAKVRLEAAHEANYMVGYLMNLDRDFWVRKRNQAAAQHST